MNKNLLEELIELVKSQKRLEGIEVGKLSSKELLNSELIEEVGKSINVDFELFSSYLYDYFLNHSDLEEGDDFNERISFIKKIFNEIKGEKHIRKFHHIENHLWRRIIRLTSEKNQESLLGYIQNLYENHEDLHTFTGAYSEELTSLNFNEKNFVSSILSVLSIINKPGVLDPTLIKLLGNIKQICKENYDYGLTSLELVVENHNNDFSLESAIISGLYEVGKKDFYNKKVIPLYEKGLSKKSVYYGLTNSFNNEYSDYNFFLKIYNDDTTSNDKIALLFALEKSAIGDLVDYSYSEFEKSMTDEQKATSILNNIRFSKTPHGRKIELLNLFVQSDSFSFAQHYGIIRSYFSEDVESNDFRTLLYSLAKSCLFENVMTVFKTYLMRIDKKELDIITIEFLIHNDAYIRHVAHDILDETSLNGVFCFSIDIRNLNPLEQYKLWVSLTQSHKEPKCLIPLLLPLLKSSSELVRDCVKFKLIEIAEDYGGSLIEVISEELEKDEEIREPIEEIIKSYDDFWQKNIAIKKGIKEIDPTISQHRLYNLHKRLHRFNMSTEIRKNVEENSIFNIIGARKIQLAKGGGWKIAGNKNISNLSKIETSFSLPRSCFINPDYNDLEFFRSKREDWCEEDFLNVSNYLSRESQ